MKYGYTCKCGWRLNRTGTRRGYAAAKEEHAFKTKQSPRGIEIADVFGVPMSLGGCVYLRKELEQSRKTKAA
jgi:hypothetical protein